MFDSKYGKVLTVVLIIAIVAIVGVLCYFGYNKIKKRQNEKEAMAVIEEFDRTHGTKTPDIQETPATDDVNIPAIDISTEAPSVNIGSSSSSPNDKTYYKGFVMIGHIKIPKTNVHLPILQKVTKKSLEASVAVLYPENAPLNQPGNVVILGHNYRNQMFFSNNKKLASGDKIYITDETGKQMTYIVYDNFEAAPEDTSFYKRDTGGVPEITLSTCTEDVNKRTIILARAQ